MSFSQARRRVRWFRWTGRALCWATGLLLFIALLKALYFLYEHASTPIERLVLGVPGKLVVLMYQGLHGVSAVTTEGLWKLAPNIDLRAPWSTGSFGFVATYFLFLLGIYLCGQANRIDARIVQTMHRVEEMIWEETLRNQVRGGATAQDVLSRTDITISLEGQQPPWYQRPWGLVLYGISLPMAVEILKVVVGLAKLP